MRKRRSSAALKRQGVTPCQQKQEERTTRGKNVVHSAREARFSTTGEPSEAPGPDDVEGRHVPKHRKGSRARSKINWRQFSGLPAFISTKFRG